MRFVICYDITDDRLRARVQESVFVATLDDELLARLVERLRKLLDLLPEKVHLFSQCRTCAGKVWQLGGRAVPEDQEYYIV